MNMEPYLQHLILCRDVLNDKAAEDYSAVRIFDTIWIGANDTTVVYSFHIIGRLMLNRPGTVNLAASMRIKNPTGTVIRTEELGPVSVRGDIGVNLHALLLAMLFDTEGKYSVDVNIRVDGGEAVTVGPSASFWVKKLPDGPQIA